MKRKQIICLVLMIIVMGVIFYFSNQPAEKSHAISNAVADGAKIETHYEWEESSSIPLLLGLNLRKWAHIGLYAVLGMTAWLAFESLWKSFLICYAYACLDEVHQVFINGRTANITDTFLDAIGFGIVILICFSISNIRKAKLSRRTRN